MSKKHFIELADMVRDSKPHTDTENYRGTYHTPAGLGAALHQWEVMRDKLASFCAGQNSRFNRERWLSYIAGECGPSGGAVKGGAK